MKASQINDLKLVWSHLNIGVAVVGLTNSVGLAHRNVGRVARTKVLKVVLQVTH